MKNMKSLVKYICIISFISCISSCESWLDVVPDNLPTINDIFKNRATAERALFSCYSYLPNPQRPWQYPTYFTSRDEFDYGTNMEMFSRFPSQIARGEQNTNSPILDYWRGQNGGINLFQAIRTCNIFLEGIHQPRDITEWERKKWIAEVKFLKAYYHFFLLKLYGPIPLIKENIPLSATPDEVRIYREPVDECVAYIEQLINEAVPYLPLIVSEPNNELGRITKPIALSVRAKALAWGASPLFNGNPDYREWRDSRGKRLVSDYSREKWEKAAEAIRNAIDTCHLANLRLYVYNKAASQNTFNMNDSLLWTMNVRKGITDKWNTGIIWSSNQTWGGGHDEFQRILSPLLYASDAGRVVAFSTISFNMAELFYTKNGIPIDEDKDWNYADRYQLRLSTEEAGNKYYIPLGQETVSFHFDREPRFYASMAFDRGYFELASTAVNSGASFSMYVGFRQGNTGNSFTANATGYSLKKMISFETSGDPFTGADYRFPLIRLSDLYLLYSEALNEVKDAPDDEVYFWVDSVRAITGLKGVLKSWENSRFPNRPKDKEEMRKIIQQERLIELAFEGQRFWDMRRWRLYDQSRTYAPIGWNNKGRTASEYYTITSVADGLKFSTKDYLWPISISDLRVNPNLVQTYGW